MGRSAGNKQIEVSHHASSNFYLSTAEQLPADLLCSSKCFFALCTRYLFCFATLALLLQGSHPNVSQTPKPKPSSPTSPPLQHCMMERRDQGYRPVDASKNECFGISFNNLVLQAYSLTFATVTKVGNNYSEMNNDYAFERTAELLSQSMYPCRCVAEIFWKMMMAYETFSRQSEEVEDIYRGSFRHCILHLLMARVHKARIDHGTSRSQVMASFPNLRRLMKLDTTGSLPTEEEVLYPPMSISSRTGLTTSPPCSEKVARRMRTSRTCYDCTSPCTEIMRAAMSLPMPRTLLVVPSAIPSSVTAPVSKVWLGLFTGKRLPQYWCQDEY